MASSLFHLHKFSNRFTYLGCVRSQPISSVVFTRYLSTPPKGKLSSFWISCTCTFNALTGFGKFKPKEKSDTTKNKKPAGGIYVYLCCFVYLCFFVLQEVFEVELMPNIGV